MEGDPLGPSPPENLSRSLVVQYNLLIEMVFQIEITIFTCRDRAFLIINIAFFCSSSSSFSGGFCRARNSQRRFSGGFCRARNSQRRFPNKNHQKSIKNPLKIHQKIGKNPIFSPYFHIFLASYYKSLPVFPQQK